MARVYRSICMEIDEVTLKIIHLSERLITCKLEVEKLMNNGFVNIAKARYIMGSKCVSTLQLPTEHSNPIRPLATVCRVQHDGHWIFKSNRKNPSPTPSDEKLLTEKMKNETAKTEVIHDLLQKDSSNIRKRKDFYLVEDGNYKELNEEFQDEISTDSSDSQETQVTYTDPIRLFGVLVPYTLRIAQKNFQDVLNVILQCATIQSETDEVLKRYHHLMKVKKLIECAAVERNFDLSDEKEYWTPSEVSSESSETVTKTTSDHSESEERKSETEGEDEKSKSWYVTDDSNFEMGGEDGNLIIGPAENSEGSNDYYDEGTDKSEKSYD